MALRERHLPHKSDYLILTPKPMKRQKERAGSSRLSPDLHRCPMGSTPIPTSIMKMTNKNFRKIFLVVT